MRSASFSVGTGNMDRFEFPFGIPKVIAKRDRIMQILLEC
jgi:hypothetical protein